MSCGPWILPEELRELAEADESLVLEVLRVYRTDTAGRIAKLTAALDRDDRGQVGSQAHALKGSSGQVGAMEVASLCRQIEAEAAAGPAPVLRELTARLEAAFAEVLRVMPA